MLRRCPLPAAGWVAAVVAVTVGGCGTTGRAPVTEGTPQPAVSAQHGAKRPAPRAHTVEAGDTLYSIAWRYGLDYRDVANWNGIGPPYLILPRQVIRLQPAASPPAAAPRRSVATQSPPVRAQTPSDSKPRAQPVRAAPAGQKINWAWPTLGKVIRSDAPTAKKGIDISGKVGQVVKAAAAGHVVYSGSGLFGYGRLIIIKHNDAYLSAYAHNSSLMVEEGDRVSVGQQIATMGLGMSGEPVLHFEIRKDGQPVNPLEHLPRVPS